MEDYLEVIFSLQNRHAAVMPGHIAEELKVRPPSVTKALHKLAARGLITHKPREAVKLTRAGSQEALRVSRGHVMLRLVFGKLLNLSDESTESLACAMEHSLTEDATGSLAQLAAFLETAAGADFFKAFGAWCQKHSPDSCEERLSENIEPPHTSSHTLPSQEATLDQIPPGKSCTLIKVQGGGAIQRRLLDMGLVRGAPITVVRVAPLGDPIEITVRGYQLSLRRSEAATILVQEVP